MRLILFSIIALMSMGIFTAGAFADISNYEVIINYTEDEDEAGSIANFNQSENYDNLKAYLSVSNDPIAILEELQPYLKEKTDEAGDILRPIQNENLWNPDGTQTQEYITAWMELRAYNDILRIVNGIQEAMTRGMNLESAIDTYDYVQFEDPRIVLPDEGDFDLPCHMQGFGQITPNSCQGFYTDGFARSVVTVSSLSGSHVIENAEASGYFFDKFGSHLGDVTVDIPTLQPYEQVELYFYNTVQGAVSSFEMQVIGGDLIEIAPPTHPELDEDSEFDFSFDKTSYKTDDIIKVNGLIQNYRVGDIVTYLVQDQNKNSIFIEQIIPNNNGSFEFTVHIDGPMWKQSGKYSIMIYYDDEKISRSFEFVSDESNSNTQEPEPTPVDPNLAEISELKSQIIDLKLENRELKQQMEDMRLIVLEQIRVIMKWFS